ncbi:MAG TPA: T9SS type A sorting domain-containing protein [Saprospiraceae bacterium]|nr:T9SS type A sorting domain-containing protein [Saprospiraceae bacterium]HMP23872.1 T9SS type A sorting domain-containing protein [Saprospiraceae bacterium]
MRFIYPVSLLLSALFLPMQIYAQSAAVPVYLDFPADEIFVLENTQAEFMAHIYVGAQHAPARDLQAITFDVVFPADLVIPEATRFDYNNSSFFGTANEITILPNDPAETNKGRLRITLRRTGNKNITGFGEIGTVRFITIHDIIGSRNLPEIPFRAHLENVQLWTPDGSRIAVSDDDNSDTIMLVNDILARSARSLERRVEIYPNPAREQIYLHFEGIREGQVEIFDAQGQRLHVAPIRSDFMQIPTRGFLPGIYMARVRTESGAIISRRLLITR